MARGKRQLRIKKRTGNRTAIYLRKSSDAQEASIERQRESLQRYAKRHDLMIVETYTDAGISGVDSTDHRPGFQSLVEGAELGKFDAVLVWDFSRLSRSDPMETAAELRPLRRAGIRLFTADKNEIDWDSFSGQLVMSIESNAGNEYVRKMARNTADGQRKLAESGKWVSGRPPFGYKLGKDRKLVISSKKDAELIRWMFRRYRDGDSLRTLLADIKKKGHSRGLSWVRQTLANPLYVGDWVWNRTSQGKFFAIRDGAPTDDFNNGKTPKADHVVIKDNHPAIVDRELFDEVQSLFSIRKKDTSPKRGGGGFVFSGLVRCSKCGYSMAGMNSNGKIWYRCTGHTQHGTCHPYLVSQNELVAAVVDSLESRLSKAAIEAKRRAVTGKRVKASEVSNLKKKRAALAEKIDQAYDRLLEVPSDMIPAVTEKVRDLEEKAKRLDELISSAAIPKADQLAEFEARIDATIKQMDSLKDAARTHPKKFRTLMRETVAELRVEIEARRAGTRNRYTFTGGELLLREGQSLIASW